MSERRGSRKRAVRGRAASRFDEITLAAFTVAVLVAVAAVLHFGPEAAEARIGCRVNDLVNMLLVYPRPCR